MADAALNSPPPRFFFHFAMTGALNVTDKRRAKNSSDSVLRDDAAEFVGCDAEQREIEQTRFLWQLVALNRNSSQRCGAGREKCEHESVLGEQLFLALFFLFRFVAVFLD